MTSEKTSQTNKPEKSEDDHPEGDGQNGRGEDDRAQAAVQGEPTPEGPEDPIAALERDKAELEQKNKETFDRLLRATADLENFRKRAQRDLEDARISARSRVLREILPVIDNLERAVDHAETTAAGDNRGIIEGVSLVLRQFAQALDRSGVTPVEAMHQPFDPNIHEAVGQMESAEHPAGTVIQVLQKGYKIDQRLLRPALVVVSREPAPAGEEADGPQANGADDSASKETGDGGVAPASPRGNDDQGRGGE